MHLFVLGSLFCFASLIPFLFLLLFHANSFLLFLFLFAVFSLFISLLLSFYFLYFSYFCTCFLSVISIFTLGNLFSYLLSLLKGIIGFGGNGGSLCHCVTIFKTVLKLWKLTKLSVRTFIFFFLPSSPLPLQEINISSGLWQKHYNLVRIKQILHHQNGPYQKLIRQNSQILIFLAHVLFCFQLFSYFYIPQNP